MRLLPLEVPVDVTREEAARRAAEELSKSKYPQGLPSWFRDLLAWAEQVVTDYLRALFADPEPTGGGGGVGALVVVVVVLAAIAYLVWRVGLPRIRRRVGDAEVAADPETAPATYRRAAADAAAAGRWRDAVTATFRALVRDLEEHTVLAPRPARTALEVARVGGSELPDARDDLFAAAELFSATMYGDEPATEASYARLVELDQQVMAIAARTTLATTVGHP